VSGSRGQVLGWHVCFSLGKRPDQWRLWRLINDFGEIRGMFGKKEMLKKYERSRNVYENKQISDKMPGKDSDIFV
jgi:hypothetical protein